MNYISYLAYGDPGYINECRFSLLKLLSVYNLHVPADMAVIVYTDKPEAFENYIPFFRQFYLEHVTQEKILEWQAGTGYIHRAKPKMIQDIFAKHPGNLIFFDTDTYITQPIDRLWEGISRGLVYMHLTEGVVDQDQNPEFRKWDEFLKNNTIRFNEKAFTYSPDFQIWNTGVLGLSPLHAPIMDDVLSLIDSIYKQFPKHIAEQVACSYCFSRKAEIKPAASEVFHYWNLKEFRKLLNLFFTKNQEESVPNLIKLAHHLDASHIQNEKNQYKKLPFYKRFIKNLTGNRWTIDKYQKKI